MRRLWFVVALVGVALLALAAPAHAHAVLRGSDPADGARLERSPEHVTLTFTEPPERALSTVRVLDASGAPQERGPASVVDGQPRTMRVPVKPLERGVYVVTWRVVSTVDGHTTAGAFAFGVGETPSDDAGVVVPGVTTPPPSPLEMVGRLSLFLGLGALVGAGAGALVFAGIPSTAMRIASAGWVVSLVGVVLLGEAQRRAAGVSVAALLPTVVGRALVWRAAAIVGAGGALAVARAARTRWGLIVAAAAASGALFAHTAAGHAGAHPRPWVAITAQWAHATAAAVWIAGLLILILGIRRLDAEGRVRAARRFSRVAAAALALVVATGIARTLHEVDAWRDLVATGYGRALVVKIVLLIALAVLGAVNRTRSVPRAGNDPSLLRRVARLEVALGVMAFAAAAVLASLQPPTALAGDSASRALVASGTDFATTVRVRLSVEPGVPGRNAFVVEVRDYDTREPLDARRVSLRFTYEDDPSVAPATIELDRQAPGRWSARAATLALQGRWTVGVLIETPTRSVDVPLTIATRCTAVAQPFAGQPTLHTIELPGGRSIQGYLDPGRPGRIEAHATFFDADGGELAIERFELEASVDGGERRTLPARRLTEGHFVAPFDRREGTWRFEIVGHTGTETIRGCFEEEIG